MARPSTGQVVERRGKRDTSFGVRFHANRKRHYLTLGYASEGWNRPRAELELQNVLADVRRGTWKPPAPEPAVEAWTEEPTFHELASAWVERRKHEVDARTVEHWRWALSTHLLPFFADFLPSQITAAVVDRYKAEKLDERERRLAAIGLWRKADPAKRGRMPARPLGNASINKTLKVLAQVLADAVRLDYIDSNIVRDREKVPRLKAGKPRRTWLELHEVQALLAAAGKHRALLATMILAGLRVGELVALRWRDVDLGSAKLRVADSKTDAGVRAVEMIPLLLDELKAYRAARSTIDPNALVFGTSRGTPRNRSNITRQILHPAIERANAKLAAEGRSPIEGVTNHSLRRTFASLLYESGATPAQVMEQMGHEDPALALAVYTKVMERKRDTGARMDALVRGADWAPIGTNDAEALDPLSTPATEKPLIPAAS